MDTQDLLRDLDEITSGYQRSQILFSALNAGIFPLLEEPRTAQEVADALGGWSPRGVRMLLDSLVALELVSKTDGRYRNGAMASSCLVPGAPTDQTHIIKHKAFGWETWGKLQDAVRTGSPVQADRPEQSSEELRAFICGMADIAKHSARAMLEELDVSPYRRMLDVGGGPGTYAIAFLEANPDMQATVLDLPDVLPIGREHAASTTVADRLTFTAGDMTADSFGSGYDLILLSNIIHSYGSEMNRELVRKSYDALEPGGLLIIKDFLVSDDRTGPPFGLIFALNMLIHTEAGDTYTTAEVCHWTDAAGFGPGRLLDLTPQTRLWLAEKPR